MASKKALVGTTRTGTTRLLAEKIAATAQCDIEELIDTKRRAGVLGWLGGGKDSTRGKGTVLGTVQKNPTLYDIIIIGTPVWAFSMTPAVRTFITEHRAHFKQVAFFCTMGGSGDDRTLRKMEELCGRSPKAVLACTQKSVQADACGELISAFVKTLALTA